MTNNQTLQQEEKDLKSNISRGIYVNAKLDLSYKNYKKNKKGTKLLSRKNFKRAKRLFLKKAAEEMVDSKGGLYLDGIGYFGVLRSYRARPIYTRGNKGVFSLDYNIHSKGYSYTLNKFDVKTSEACNLWKFRATKEITSRLTRNIKKQYKYEFRFKLVRNIYLKNKYYI